MGAYAKCPNGCTGEVPLYVEVVSGPDPSVGLPNGAYAVGVDEDENATSDDEGCPLLTQDQVDKITGEFDVHAYLDSEAEAAATGYL